MKKKKNYLLLPVVGCLILLSSCAKTMHFGTSIVSPGATGSVKIKKDNNGNYALNISVTNLAPSLMLTPPKRTYVVWMTASSNETKNIGQLKSSNNLISKTYRASLKTTTVFEPANVFITAENEAQPESPDGAIVLQTIK